MKNVFSILLLLAPFFCISQKNENWLRLKFKNADSVLLVSHDYTEGIAIVDDAGNRRPPYDRKWEELEKLFARLGFKYELEFAFL
jgi:hypothetical protein